VTTNPVIEVNDFRNRSVNLNVGYVKSVADGIVKASGLKNVAFGEVVTFLNTDNIRGITCNLNKNDVDILILGDDRFIKVGMVITGTSTGLRVPVTKKLLGRVINPIGEIIDGGSDIDDIKYNADINVKAPGIIFRQKVSEPVFTGIKIIDALIPIGKGQRELIIGDKGTGKTSIAFDTILSQRNENMKSNEDSVFCIYVSIGQKKSSVKSIHQNLIKFGADKFTIIVSASASDNASLQYLAPYSGCAIGEFFMSFAHALIIYDDSTQHAASYRQISLLLRRPPGREAYPGDVFHLHSRLLERAAKLSVKYGGGSLTALPIIETLFGDVTAYIPTNVISITDGQIFLDRNLFTEGVLPAVNIGLSVSRVGSAAQILAMKKVAGSLKLELAQYREVKDSIKFGSDLNEDTLRLIRKGKLLTELLKQKRFNPVSPEEQVVTLYVGLNTDFSKVNVNELDFIKNLISFINKSSLFKPHFDLLRFDNYFKEFGMNFLKLITQYFYKFKLTSN
jgi:F-type H+/Na+-transporting ATPase subunit alpha